MKIVVDDKIPYIREKLNAVADVVDYLPAAAITPDTVRDADALVVRTRTRCDRRLLGGSRVQFVATATIGYDHIDTDYMRQAGIRWTNCPGCNSGSVAQYVECALLLLQRDKGLRLTETTIGIVGCGHVGSKVKAVAERMGMRTLVCDPPLAAAARRHPLSDSLQPLSDGRQPAGFVTMDTICREADVITFHVPLTRQGEHATWHMADKDFMNRLSRVPIIINSSRGEVVDNEALLTALREGRVRDAVVDVWEHEPLPDPGLLQSVFIGTPHIAGYSADGKVNADNMVVDALCRHFHVPHPGLIAPPPLPAGFRYTGSPLDLYDPSADSERLKSNPRNFEFLRNHYPLRRERFDI